MHGFLPKKVFDGLCYPGSLTRPNCFNFIGDEIRINVQKDFIEKIYLLIRACHVVKMFGPCKQFNAFPNGCKVCLIIVPNPTCVCLIVFNLF